MAHIAHYAHDLKLFVFWTEILDVFADWIFSGEYLLRCRFVDDRYRHRTLDVVLIEIPTAHQWDPHRLEVFRRRHPDVGPIFFCAARTIECSGTVPARQGKATYGPGALDTRHTRQALHDLLVKLNLVIFVGRAGRTYIC